MNEFAPFPKIPRLSRDCVITEKLDGTNASVRIEYWAKDTERDPHMLDYFYGPDGSSWGIWAGSRNRWLTLEDDNYGFARWVMDNKDCLKGLGHGHHFGEWWGAGIQRGYDLKHKHFSLFNTERWNAATKPPCCSVVPVLYTGPFCTRIAEDWIHELRATGSAAVPGFMDPEGIVIYHSAAGHMFKKTCKGDEVGKHQEQHMKKERPPKPPKDPSKGGRRKIDAPYEGADRRVAR